MQPGYGLSRLEALRSRAEYRHEQNVGSLTCVIAVAMGLGEERATVLGRAASLHDIGKLALPDAMLDKAGPLSNAELELMKMHPKFGWNILNGSIDPELSLAASIALNHHEHFDGSGYPNGIAGDTIPFEARIISVADVYAALREERAYKSAMTHEGTLRVMLRGDEQVKPAYFDPTILRVLKDHERTISEAYGRAPHYLTEQPLHIDAANSKRACVGIGPPSGGAVTLSSQVADGAWESARR